MTALSRAILAFAQAITPASRKDWIDAMAAELSHVPAHHKTRFAMGAARFSITAMLEETMIDKSTAGSFAIMLGSAFLAFVGISNGLRNFSQDPAASVAFCMMGALWLAAFVAAMLRRWDMLTRIASGGLAAAVALGAAWSIALPAMAANRTLFGALALEAVVLFAVLLVAGMLVRKLAVPSF